MSLATDVRAYADAVLEQGKHAVEAVSTRAQSRIAAVADDLGGVADDATERANETVEELRERGETLVAGLRSRDLSGLTETAKSDLATLKSALRPYLVQAFAVRDAFVEKTDDVVSDLAKDPRVARAYATVEDVANTVVETIGERVVTPALSLIGREQHAAHQPARPSSSRPTKAPASKATKAPAAKKTPARTPATKSTANKSTTAKSTTAKSTTAKAPAKRTATKRTATS